MHLHLSLPDQFAGDAAFLTAGHVETYVETYVGGNETESSDDDDDDGGGSLIATFIPLILIFAIGYFLLLRPRQRQARQQRELQSQLDVGDEIMLTSGVYGFVTGIESASDVVWVEIDDDVQIRVSRRAISGKVDTSSAGTTTGPAEPADTPAEATKDTARDSASSKRPTLKGGGRPSSGAAGTVDRTDTDEPADE
jgi:preprotein translocase subunit YajC